jgi:hypothetical protein
MVSWFHVLDFLTSGHCQGVSEVTLLQLHVFRRMSKVAEFDTQKGNKLDVSSVIKKLIGRRHHLISFVIDIDSS